MDDGSEVRGAFSDLPSSTSKRQSQALEAAVPVPGLGFFLLSRILEHDASVSLCAGLRRPTRNSPTFLLKLISSSVFAAFVPKAICCHLGLWPVGSLSSLPCCLRPFAFPQPFWILTIQFQPVAKQLFVFLLTRIIFPSLFTSDILKWQFQYLAK